MQVWSNPQALEEYQDLLSGKQQVASVDVPSVIVGGGRVGEMLRGAGGGDDVVVGRGGKIPETHEGLDSFPIYVCVPNSELEGVIRSCPSSKLDDLVFVQDGMIEPILKKYALCGNENTQMLPYFTLFSKGGRPQDSLVDLGTDAFGEAKYAGETSICGKWAGALKQRLDRLNLHSRILFYRDWRRAMLEKILFDSVFPLVGSMHKGLSIGEVGQRHTEECQEMITEIAKSLPGTLAVTLMYGVEERLFAYSQHDNVEYRPCKIEQYPFRNGFWYTFSQQAKQIGFPDPTPMHTEYLELAKEKGIIDFNL